MSKKEPYNLVKVVDPHKNLPNDIKRCLLDGMQDREYNNDTFIWWTVGEYDYVVEDDEDSVESFEDFDRKKVDDWFLENGFSKNERVLVLYWW